MNQETKQCQNCKKDFTIELEDFNFYEKMKVPAPTFCPECRLFRRLIWRNERIFFRRPESLTGKEVFSGFPPQAKITVYDIEYWKSDAWDALDYGKEYDFSKSFFEQFKELIYQVPWPSRAISNLVNSDYSNQADYLKNTYLVHNSGYVENSAYVVRGHNTKDSFDILESDEVELAYDSTFFTGGFKIFYCFDCVDCHDIWLSKDLHGCSNCVGCAGLRGKNYCIFNKQYTKEEYAIELEKLNLNTYSGLETARKKAYEIWQKTPVKYYHGKLLVNCVADNAQNSKNCKESWGIRDSQDSKFCQNVYECTDSYDYSVWGEKASQMYECLTCGSQVENMKFCFDCWPGSKDLEYCMGCRSSSDLFGCVGLKRKQYCVFNKQYTKEEYEKLVARIKDQMIQVPFTDSRGRVYKYGEFFPQEFSPFAYNESHLQDLFPKTKEQAEELGFFLREQPVKEFKITLQSSELPDSIDEVQDDILNQVVSCGNCGKAYKIIATELQFLRQMKLPLPRLCVECRFQARNKFINSPFFYNRNCAKCQTAIRTTYAPDRKEIVYCESCYNSEVS